MTPHDDPHPTPDDEDPPPPPTVTVPTEADPLGRDIEPVTTDPIAAQDWDARRWRRGAAR